MSLEVAKEFFLENFKSQPCITELSTFDEDSLNKFISKSHLIWYYSNFESGKLEYSKRIFEYDSSGVYVYSEIVRNEDGSFKEFNEYKVFILSLITKKQVVEYVLKINKPKK